MRQVRIDTGFGTCWYDISKELGTDDYGNMALLVEDEYGKFVLVQADESCIRTRPETPSEEEASFQARWTDLLSMLEVEDDGTLGEAARKEIESNLNDNVSQARKTVEDNIAKAKEQIAELKATKVDPVLEGAQLIKAMFKLLTPKK